ncbi:MAG: hypothetical protein N2508_01280, partial [Anaerolineae bacterium]|nr:hypothetical protein [Anaerolineae bacterium]
SGFEMECRLRGASPARVDTCIVANDGHFQKYGARAWEGAQVHPLAVDEAVVEWLVAHSEQLSDSYVIQVRARREGLIWLSARFESGFEMECRLRGASPARVDTCIAAGDSHVPR